MGMKTVACYELLMDVEDESEVCEMLALALGVGVVVTDSLTALPGPGAQPGNLQVLQKPPAC